MKEKNKKKYYIVFVSVFLLSIITAAHFYRQSEKGLVVVSLISPFLLIFPKKWIWLALQYIIFLNSIEWLKTTFSIITIRITTKEPYLKVVFIMSAILFLNILSLLLITNKNFKKRYHSDSTSYLPSFFGFVFITILAAIPYKKLHSIQPLILERLLPTFGWLEIFFLGIYGAILIEKILLSKYFQFLRKKIWVLFSLVFFVQFLLGLSGFSQFLMSNKLHLPIPGILIAGPIFRGNFSLFMPLLLFSSLILIGPAWCSWLCYFGPLDLIAAGKNKNPTKISIQTTIILRIILMCLLITIPLLLRFVNANIMFATVMGILYGITGIYIMIKLSKNKGVMIHCTSYCPIGLINTIIGKINPFRIKIKTSCIKCNKCINVCKYGALSQQTLYEGAPDLRCTLCGDCVFCCVGEHIQYSFLSLSPQISKKIFITIIIIIHTLFLGFGRI